MVEIEMDSQRDKQLIQIHLERWLLTGVRVLWNGTGSVIMFMYVCIYLCVYL